MKKPETLHNNIIHNKIHNNIDNGLVWDFNFTTCPKAIQHLNNQVDLIQNIPDHILRNTHRCSEYRASIHKMETPLFFTAHSHAAIYQRTCSLGLYTRHEPYT